MHCICSLLSSRCSFVSPHYCYLLPLLLSFSLVCAAWESTFLASWAFGLSLSPSLSFSLSLSACVYAQFSRPSSHWQNHTHQPQLASHKRSHTSLTEEVGHFNGDAWSACICPKWIVTWNCFLLPGRAYKPSLCFAYVALILFYDLV